MSPLVVVAVVAVVVVVVVCASATAAVVGHRLCLARASEFTSAFGGDTQADRQTDRHAQTEHKHIGEKAQHELSCKPTEASARLACDGECVRERLRWTG